jgi:hypothetical protein
MEGKKQKHSTRSEEEANARAFFSIYFSPALVKRSLRVGFSQILFFPSWFIMFIWQGYQKCRGSERAEHPPNQPAKL